jgi:hypothetical protein
MTIYDLIIVGSGPSSVSFLDGLNHDLNIAVITGEKGDKINFRNIHKNISYKSEIIKDHKPCRDFISNISNTKNMIYTSARIAGLSNYWGKQLVEYNENDNWPVEFFENYTDYKINCEKVKLNYQFDDFNFKKEIHYNGFNYILESNKLLKNLKNEHVSNPIKIKFESLIKKKNFSIFNNYVVSIKKKKNISILLDNKINLNAKKVIISAGVYGTGKILLNSFEDLINFEFKDHDPLFFFYYDKKLKLNDYNFGFNNLKISLDHKKKNRLYANIYKLSKKNFSFLFNYFNLPLLFNKYKIPKIFDMIIPIQVWNENSIFNIRVNKKNFFESEKMKTLFETAYYNNFISLLKCNGIILKKKKTLPGNGFHYHSLFFSTQKKNQISIAELLFEKFGNDVICIDGSILNKISPTPHSLTLMATAYSIGQKFQI